MNRILVVLIFVAALTGCSAIKSMTGGESTSSTANDTAATSDSADTNKASGASDAAASDTTTEATESQSDKGIYGNIPLGSPFSKVDLGMSSAHVIDLIGPPTSRNVYQTGKAWIPFYYGNDVRRLELRYKGQGVITFTGARYDTTFNVYRVDYNPEESGYME